jgi:hypothetical protein
MNDDRDQDELLNYVAFRLYGDDDHVHDGRDLSLLLPDYGYRLAKWWARNGDLEPLRKLLVDRMHDPEIAEFITQPPAPPWPKHVRKDLAYTKPFLELARQSQYETMQQVKQILVEERGFKPYGLNAKVAEIAAKLLSADENELKDLLERAVTLPALIWHNQLSARLMF